MMVKTLKNLFVLVLLFGISGCNDSDKADQPSSSKKAKADSIDYSKLVTEADIRKLYNLGSEIEITTDSKYGHSFSWMKPNQEEIKAINGKRGEAFASTMIKGLQSGERPKPPVLVSSKARIEIYEGVHRDTAELAMQAFDRSIGSMNEGVTAEVDGHSTTFKMKYEPTDGIGEKAAWNKKNGQLTVVSGRTMFHVSSTIGDEIEGDAQLDSAKKLAALVISKL